MSVSVLNSYSVSTRQALSNSLSDAALAATKMATGEGIQHAYEDPTGLAIGSSMKGDLDVLKIVYTGVKQTQSMLYIAEEGMKAIHNTFSKLNQTLAKAKLGFMTDDLVKSTLSPTYQQLSAEINRIADSIDFNGQKLLNGTGGRQTAATVSTVGAANYIVSADSTLTLSGIDGKHLVGFDFSATGAAPGNLEYNYTTAKYTVSGGAITMVNDTVTITGATLSVRDIGVKDAASASGSFDLTVANVDVSFSGATYDPSSKSFITNAAATIPSNLGDYTVSNLSTGWTLPTVSTEATGFVTPATPGFNVATPNNNTPVTPIATVNAIDRTYILSGGSTATSTFNFVTGSDLNKAIVEVAFPNLRLTAANGVNGLIETVNTVDNILSTAPISLTKLQSISDADIDIPLVQALTDKAVEYIDALGAYQARLMNIEAQLATSVAQVDLAQGAIMNADLADQTEVFTRENVKINVAIAVLGQMNASLKALERLVQ